MNDTMVGGLPVVLQVARDDTVVKALDAVPTAYKIAVAPHAAGDTVTEYGIPIGAVTGGSAPRRILQTARCCIARS